jgi:hypothetical protein
MVARWWGKVYICNQDWFNKLMSTREMCSRATFEARCIYWSLIWTLSDCVAGLDPLTHFIRSQHCPSFPFESHVKPLRETRNLASKIAQDWECRACAKHAWGWQFDLQHKVEEKKSIKSSSVTSLSQNRILIIKFRNNVDLFELLSRQKALTYGVEAIG